MIPNILIVEDEPTIATLLSYNLNKENFKTTIVNHGGEAFRVAMDTSFDLILLDIMLPGLNGFQLLEKWRQEGMGTPIIILTARNAEEEIVQGLVSGADDYMTKPFALSELLARVHAVLRRTQLFTGGEKQPVKSSEREEIIQLGELNIYPEKYEVHQGGKSITLRPKEFQVLLYMTKRIGKIITREELMNDIWGFDYFGEQRTVDVHVSSLRKKLEMNQQSVQIDAVRGVGYKLIVR